MNESIDAVIVPRGQEYQAVCRAMRRSSRSVPILAIPVGTQPTTDYLTKILLPPPRKPLNNFLLCGLCGSLSAQYNNGDALIYQSYTYICEPDRQLQLDCDRQLIADLQAKITRQTFLVNGLTSDRLVSAAAKKHSLARKYRVEAIDMEGFVVQKTLQELVNGKLATIRVVSDNCQHDIPDLSRAIDSDGQIRPLPLTLSMLRQPIAATRLIFGSLKGLQVLERVIGELFA